MPKLREQLAWASGLFEGEGTIGCWVNSGANGWSGGRQIVTRLVMTDLDVMMEFADIFDALGFNLKVTKAKKLYGYENKIRYTVHTNNFEQTQALVAVMWPWLGARRRQQAKKALAGYKTFYSF